MGVVHLVVLDYLLMATTKKVVNFFGEKSAPPDKILATPIRMSVSYPIVVLRWPTQSCVARLLDRIVQTHSHSRWNDGLV